MTKLLVTYILGLGLVGCTSINYENTSQSPIVPKNEAINTFKMPEHGIVTEQDMNDIPEYSNLNSKYTMSF